ncbi:MAG TPA: hypothetical protein VF049_02640 [Nocardioidaceae bacterium]
MTSPRSTTRPRLGLPVPLVVLLALLAVPRVVVHDLGLAGADTGLNAVLVFGPPVVWLAVVLWRRPPNPLLTLAAVGLCYGVLLAAGHQLMWEQAFQDDPPALGGRLRGALPPVVESATLRGAAVVSSVVTGTLVGALTGAVAWGVERARR